MYPISLCPISRLPFSGLHVSVSPCLQLSRLPAPCLSPCLILFLSPCLLSPCLQCHCIPFLCLPVSHLSAPVFWLHVSGLLSPVSCLRSPVSGLMSPYFPVSRLPVSRLPTSHMPACPPVSRSSCLPCPCLPGWVRLSPGGRVKVDRKEEGVRLLPGGVDGDSVPV